MSTHVTPTKAQIQLFNDLRNTIHYPPTHEALEKGVALIVDYEALRFAEWERQILQLKTELAGVRRSAKCPHVITDHEGTSHCSLAERDGRELAKERVKSAALHAALTEADDCLYQLSKLCPVQVERIYAEAQERVNAALKL